MPKSEQAPEPDLSSMRYFQEYLALKCKRWSATYMTSPLQGMVTRSATIPAQNTENNSRPPHPWIASDQRLNSTV